VDTRSCGVFLLTLRDSGNDWALESSSRAWLEVSNQIQSKKRRPAMKKLKYTYLVILFFFLLCVSASAQVEQLVSFTVSDEATLVESLDAWFASKDSHYGQTATLVSVIAGGSGPSTHYLVINYPDYDNYQAALDGVTKSGDFAKLERRISGIVKSNGDGVYLPVTNNDKSEKTGDFLYTVDVNVTGPDRVYIAAFNDLMNSAIGKKAPGIFKLVAKRAGGNSSHLVILSAPSFAALNKYLDSYSGDKDWASFQAKAGAISAAAGTSFLRVVKVWK
jgi:hypothetical protein